MPYANNILTSNECLQQIFKTLPLPRCKINNILPVIMSKTILIFLKLNSKNLINQGITRKIRSMIANLCNYPRYIVCSCSNINACLVSHTGISLAQILFKGSFSIKNYEHGNCNWKSKVFLLGTEVWIVITIFAIIFLLQSFALRSSGAKNCQ